jgi:hypothetical protein
VFLPCAIRSRARPRVSPPRLIGST